MKPRLASLVPLLALGLLGCSDSGGDKPADQISVARSELFRDLNPQVSSEDSATLASDNLAFATELYATLRSDPGNLFLSPHSISTALAMTYAGAKGTTATEMAATLHYSLPSERLHPAFNRLDLELESRASGQQGEGQPFQLSIANALFGSKGLGFESAFLDLLAVNYGAAMSLLDFSDEETARSAINDWVAENTNDRIPELIDRGILDADTALVLANAVYFKADWQSPFEAESTNEADFTHLDGSTAVVNMMSQVGTLDYAKGEGWAAVSLEYLGGDLAMTIVLPDEGAYDTVENELSGSFVSTVLAELTEVEVALRVPKFQFTAEFELSTQLSNLGMPTAFSPRADFSGMTTETHLWIDSVIHKAFVAVDEKGTEAAAATAVEMKTESEPMPPETTFEANRPFLFFIHDRETGAVLFLGRVVEPT